MAPSDSRRGCRPMSASRPLPSPRRVSPVARITFPTCCAHYPGGPNRCICRWLPCPRGLPRFAGGSASATSLSRPAQAITHVTARRVARPPKAAFVTRLRSGKLPNQTARQLPDLSTTIWVDSASTGYPCLCGAHSEIRVKPFRKPPAQSRITRPKAVAPSGLRAASLKDEEGEARLSCGAPRKGAA